MRCQICYKAELEDPYSLYAVSGPDTEADDFWVQLLQRSFSGYKSITGILVDLFISNKSREEFPLEVEYSKRDFYRGLFKKLMLRQPVYCFAVMDDELAKKFVLSEAQNLTFRDLI